MIAVKVDKIAMNKEKVYRPWEPQEDGSLVWRKRIDVKWIVARPNAHPKPDIAPRPMRSIEGEPFLAYDHSVTLDDFVLLRDKYAYCHIATGLTFTARQINRRIFKDETTWPTRDGVRMDPAAWIRKYNRVESTAHFNLVRSAFDVAA